MPEPLASLKNTLRSEVYKLHRSCDRLMEAVTDYDDCPGMAAQCVSGVVEQLQKVQFDLTTAVAEFNFNSRSEPDGVSGDG